MQPQYIPLPRQAKDKTGQKFGRLTAFGPVGKCSDGQLRWYCRCDCGNEVVVTAGDLNRGRTRSCGCLKREMTIDRSRVHGQCGTHLYDVWAGIKARCFNAKSKFYSHYGGRGITMWAGWANDFVAFADYVSTLEHCDQTGYSIDRTNNDGNYEPGNVRWATATEQARNVRSNHLLTIGDRTLPIAEWATTSGINPRAILKRIKRGWTAFDAVFRPLPHNGSAPKGD